MADLEIFVFILGESPASKRMFSVDAPANMSVNRWRHSLYAEAKSRLEGVSASDLTLWMLNQAIPLADVDEETGDLGQDLSSIALEMIPAKDLEDYFPASPPRKSLHVIVVPNLPSAGEKHGLSEDGTDGERASKRLHTEREEALKIARGKPSPSTAAASKGLAQAQAEDPILNGRPFEAVGPPITIYEPIFSDFRAMNEGKIPVDVSPADYKHVEAFLAASAKIYPKEIQRQIALTEPLRDLLDKVIVTVRLEDGTSNDGVIQENFGGKACLLLAREIKGDGGAGDPSVQVGYSYTRWWASSLGSHFRDRTCCPSFLLSIAGPWICVQGGILAGKSWTVQPLTEALWIGATTDIHSRGKQIGRLLCSLRVALDALTERFRNVKDKPPPSPPPCFPFITSFPDDVSQTDETIAYEDRLHFSTGREGTAIFSATLQNGHAVFVKFVTRYNAAAHRLLAQEGFAPQLRHCSELADGGTHFMVVMDRIHGHNMHNEIFQAGDLARIQEAKNLLHENNFVFGDLRPNNILKPMDGAGVVLVDFDWCGQHGLDRYPLFINKACNWHPDVRGEEIMLKAHDDHLFDMLKRS